jgi:hypothetical protein
MAKQTVEEVEHVMLARMRATATFTFSDLWTSFSENESCDEYRVADRLIQRERRAGRIVQASKRGVWKLAPDIK